MIDISKKGHTGIILLTLGIGSGITGINVGFYGSTGVAWAWGMLSALVAVAGLALFMLDVSDHNIRKEKRSLKTNNIIKEVENLKDELEKAEETNKELKARDQKEDE